MKFAVIEYNSKSGGIWRHTPEKPNYLADPVNEIDPTSFGCYVSALAGEHIPLTAFITGQQSGVSSPTVLYRKIIKRLTGSWPSGYDISYLAGFDTLMVVYQISDGHEITAFTKRLRQEHPHIKIIGVPTQPYGILMDYLQTHPGQKEDFISYLNACHVVLALTQTTLEPYQILTTSPVKYVPQPYPVEYALQYWKPLPQKKPIIFVAGVTDRPTILRGHTIAAQLQQQFPDYAIHVTNTPDKPLDTSHLEGSRYQTVPFRPWQQQLAYLSQVALVINTDYTQTRGRVQVDCASVGTPSIGADSDGQQDLFPLLTANKGTSDEQLVAQGKRLLAEPDFYKKTTSIARKRLQNYNYDQAAQRFKDLVSTL